MKGGLAAAGSAIFTPSFNIGGRAAAQGNAPGPVVMIVADDAMEINILNQYWAQPLNIHPWLMGGSGAGEGMIMRRATCTVPACGGSRPGMMSGMYGHESGILTHAHNDKATAAWIRANTFVAQAQDAGVHTVGAGKAGYHNQHNLGGVFNESRANRVPPLRVEDFEHVRSAYSSPTWAPHVTTFWAGPEIGPDQEKVDWAIRRLRNATAGHLFVIGLEATHVQYPYDVEPNRFQWPHTDNTVVMPDFDDPMSVEEARFARPFGHDGAGLAAYGERESNVRLQTTAQKHVDYQVGRIIREAPANTTFIFCSDHGMALANRVGSKYRLTKQMPGNDVARVPLMMWGFGVPKGECWTPVSLADIGPTVLDFLGLPYEGESLRDIWGRPYDDQRVTYTSYMLRSGLRAEALAAGEADMFTTVEQGDNTLTHLINTDTMEVREESLHWPHGDPFSRNDLSDIQQDRVAQMRELMPTNYEGITQ